MNKIILPILIILTFASCKKETATKIPETVAEKATIEACYKGILKQDTITMSLVIKDNLITDGKLSYHFFEKDKNEGTLKGEIKGDTIYADYTFMSEGQQSVREVAFLKQGDTYIEGYGDVKEYNGKMIFKDVKHLKFDSKTVLVKLACH
jgi:hypothetical protein